MASILVVDDDLDAREAVARYLRKASHVVRCVGNGREALTALTTATPNVVVLDLMMPEMDGVAFLEVIRCYLRWSAMPVILLTAYPDSNHVARARKLGVKRIFHKAQYELADLLACVNQCSSGNGGSSRIGC